MTDQEAAKKYAQEGLSYYSCVRVAAFIEGARYAREALEPKMKILVKTLNEALVTLNAQECACESEFICSNHRILNKVEEALTKIKGEGETK
jgi:hypothetical protein